MQPVNLLSMLSRRSGWCALILCSSHEQPSVHSSSAVPCRAGAALGAGRPAMLFDAAAVDLPAMLFSMGSRRSSSSASAAVASKPGLFARRRLDLVDKPPASVCDHVRCEAALDVHHVRIRPQQRGIALEPLLVKREARDGDLGVTPAAGERRWEGSDEKLVPQVSQCGGGD
eukprot:4059551-Prymnesium_polylepis.1